ncbi:MAG: hypothetical protein AAF845_08585, partial [Bacteroidota bacterium]
VAGRYALVERGEGLPPRPMTFAEARPQIREALDLPFAQRRLEAAVARLRARYPVEIDHAALDRFFNALVATSARRAPPPAPDRS